MNEYSARLAGFPHPDGQYNGEYRTEDGHTWFYIAAANGMDYETEDAPEHIHVLCGMVHDEHRVKDLSGVVIFAVSSIPPYWWKQTKEN